MRFLLHLLTMIVVALGVGFGLSYYALTDGRLLGALRVGPWAAWPGVGSPTPDPYTRAYLARSGALQLGQAEGLAFTATTDSSGASLERSCRYRLEGATPVASFWTLQAQAPDGASITRPAGLVELESRQVARGNDSALIAYVSPTLAPENWLEINGQGSFQLVLTLYDPSNLSGNSVSVDTLPSITREGCGA